MKENELIIVSDDKEEKVTILFTFKEKNKNYVVFEFDESEEVSAAIYEPLESGEVGTLSDITTDEEWDLVEKIFEQYEKDLEDASDEEMD